MKKDELEEFIIETRIEKGIAAGIRARCIAFWSGVLAFFGAVGSWCSNHIDAIEAGFKAFWVVLWSK